MLNGRYVFVSKISDTITRETPGNFKKIGTETKIIITIRKTGEMPEMHNEERKSGEYNTHGILKSSEIYENND